MIDQEESIFWTERFWLKNSLYIVLYLMWESILASCIFVLAGQGKESFKLFSVFLHSPLYPLQEPSIYSICPKWFHICLKIRHAALRKVGVVQELIDPLAERNMEMQHCFVSLERVDDVAKDAFDRMIRFTKSKTNWLLRADDNPTIWAFKLSKISDTWAFAVWE